MDSPRFTTEQAAAVAGVPVNTVRTWLKRGMISTHPGGSDVSPDLIARGTGWGCLFTRRSMLHIAMVARLRRLGLSVDLASECASSFLDFGEAPSQFDAVPGGGRAPGGYFQEHGTALVVQLKQGEPCISITTLTKAIEHFSPLGHHRGDPVLLLDVEAFVSDVDKTLKKI